MSLIDDLIYQGYLKTPQIIDAFQKIKRVDFLPPEFKNLAEIDEALPIGGAQTISQPAVVSFMLELLEPRPCEKILDVGAGSGWTTALLAYIVSQQGNPKSETLNPKQIQNTKLQNLKPEIKDKVIAIEVIPEVMKFGKNNVAKYNFIKKGMVEFICRDGTKGFLKEAPFDKILVSASANKECPKALKEQVKIGGRIVIPIGNSIWLFVKKDKDKFEEYEYPGFVFVPLIEAD